MGCCISFGRLFCRQALAGLSAVRSSSLLPDSEVAEFLLFLSPNLATDQHTSLGLRHEEDILQGLSV